MIDQEAVGHQEVVAVGHHRPQAANLALGELNLTILIANAGSQTLSLRIFNMIHFSYQSLVAALCLLLIGLALLPALLYWLVAGRKPEVR